MRIKSSMWHKNSGSGGRRDKLNTVRANAKRPYLKVVSREMSAAEFREMVTNQLKKNDQFFEWIKDAFAIQEAARKTKAATLKEWEKELAKAEDEFQAVKATWGPEYID